MDRTKTDLFFLFVNFVGNKVKEIETKLKKEYEHNSKKYFFFLNSLVTRIINKETFMNNM